MNVATQITTLPPRPIAPRPFPPPDPRMVVRLTRHQDVGADLLAATPWWARPVLPRRISVVVPGYRSRRPTLAGACAVALTCVLWGGIVGGVIGAAVGTLMFPVFYTICGGVAGAVVGALVGAAWAPLVVAVLVARHRSPSTPHACLSAVARTVGALNVLLAVAPSSLIVGAVVGRGLPPGALGLLCIVAVLATAISLLLRRAVVAISQAWCAPFGWRPV